jgi:hypothetical protein
MISLRLLEDAIALQLSKNRAALQSEGHLQDLIEKVLATLGVVAEREKRLNRKDRPDFWLSESGLAIEVKLRRAGLAALRQVARYLRHQDITGVLLIAQRVPGCPAELDGKPVRVIELWKYNV